MARETGEHSSLGEGESGQVAPPFLRMAATLLQHQPVLGKIKRQAEGAPPPPLLSGTLAPSRGKSFYLQTGSERLKAVVVLGAISSELDQNPWISARFTRAFVVRGQLQAG